MLILCFNFLSFGWTPLRNPLGLYPIMYEIYVFINVNMSKCYRFLVALMAGLGRALHKLWLANIFLFDCIGEWNRWSKLFLLFQMYYTVLITCVNWSLQAWLQCLLVLVILSCSSLSISGLQLHNNLKKNWWPSDAFQGQMPTSNAGLQNSNPSSASLYRYM